MKVSFSKPFDQLAGIKEAYLDLQEPVKVRDILRVIEKKAPNLERFFREDKDETLNFSVLIARGDQILRLDDLVKQQDSLIILLPISGG